ncbi:MAG: hypothetical protein ACP5PW_01740, partial [Candidatus Dormibacteria bacterium]
AVFYGAGAVRGFATDALFDRGIRLSSANAANAIPVAELTVGSLALMLVGGVYIGAHLPGEVPLLVPAALLLVGGVLTAAALGLMVRIPDFARGTFLQVARWALLAYLVIAGLLAYVFIRDGARGSMLLVLGATLFLFAVDVPTVMAFTVARYDQRGRSEGPVAR